MEPGVIHDDDFPWCESRGEALPHVFGKNIGVAISLEAKGRLQFPPAQGGDDAGAPGAVAGFFSVEPWAALAPSSRQAVAVINATFVHINQCVLGNVADRFPPQATGELIALGVQQRFFYG